MKKFLEYRNQAMLGAYAQLPSLIREHQGIEQTVLAGGYGYRQIMELVQNGADAILEAAQECHQAAGKNRIQVLLRGKYLYVANTGAPLTKEGIDALLSSHSSPKRGNQIGRFGLGFKSLLRLDGLIDVFTRASGAIRFDPDRCRTELRNAFAVAEAPGLRLAWPLPEDERGADNLLDQLAWAETIVRAEVRDEELRDHLRQEIRTFPAEFLLFFPVATALVLDDGKEPARELSVGPDGDDQLIHDGSDVSRWRVAKCDVGIVDARALADATHIHARDSVPLTWAIPLAGKREEIGRFWAFFPTHTPTYLPGILNAPWKLNSDRNAIIAGEWNSALMSAAAVLVAETLWSLSTSEDPGRPLDAFPRQPERKDEDAAPLVEALWARLEAAAVIPDAAGIQRRAYELMRHPRDSAELARKWQVLASPDDLAQIVHPSCLERQRASRLKALAERLDAQRGDQGLSHNLRASEAALWFKAIASIEVSKATEVLKLAEAYANDCKPNEWGVLRPTLAIVPSQTERLVTAQEIVFAPSGVHVPNRESVASMLCDDREATRILLEVMRVKELDDSVWESVLRESLNVPAHPDAVRNAGWKAFWERLRQAPAGIRQQFAAKNAGRIRVKRGDGLWVLADEVLLPGVLVIPDDELANKNVLVDSEMHVDDGVLLTALGVVGIPSGLVGPGSYDEVVGNNNLLYPWLNQCRAQYKCLLQPQQNPQEWYLKPFSLSIARGWMLLPKLAGRSNAKLTKIWLHQIGGDESLGELKFGHITRPDTYPKVAVPHPLFWLLLKYGALQIGGTYVRLAALAVRRHEPALGRIPDWENLRAAIERLGHAYPLEAATESEIQVLWLALIQMLATPSALAGDALRELWTAAAKDRVVPDFIQTHSGTICLSEVFVTSSADLARRARSPERVVVTLDDSALALWLERGARNLSDLMKPDWASVTGPPDLLTSAVPDLAVVMQPEASQSARCQQVTDLRLTIGQVSESVSCMMWENALLMDAGQLAALPRAERMKRLVDEVAAAGWLKCTSIEALECLGNAQVERLRAEVASEMTLAGRLLRAVGGRPEPLFDALGDLKDMDFIRQCTPLELAELTLAQLGPATLSTLADALDAEGLKPPRRWNTSEARTFVASIGFPEEFAAAPTTRRDPEEYISGPIELPPLHDFQEEVHEGIRHLVLGGKNRRRAVVSLPTGGGKTRVTVEAAVRLVLSPEGDQRSVIWVAQTDELCEQAVQAFRQVWLNLGAQKTDLRIIRLWGGNPSPTIQELDRPIAIVASIQTLNSRMGTEKLDWLQKPGLVVVDECHHAITPSYTNLLRWLDAEAQRPGAPVREEPPFIGLSATPFRTDDEESQRLARRFDSRWFPGDQEGLHTRLRAQGVLAKAEYDTLQSGTGLSDEELEQLERLPELWEGLDFENLLETINQRLAGDAQRNRKLVEQLQQCEERSILFFTNSVQHAEEMSARLNLVGISAAAVSGGTPTVARRYFLDRFQRGEIRVLCNHSVLSTGFDAPKTDMVLIARQVFSPVRYMQMVGRGLRGQKNGGTATCRIVTVMDNLGRFSEKHPYHFCARYFRDSSSTV
jgi:superfamily II DNA or RNA helicase